MFFGIWAMTNQKSANTPSSDDAISLARPWFIDEVAAQDLSGAAAINDISEEAGMSAYVKSASAINLTNAKKAFTRGVEMETADYIIGLVPVTGYDASWDAHVLVHKTGWILAYYPRAWPSAKALNEKHQTIGGSTKLSLAIDAVGSKISQSFGTKSYYNFAYPSATKMLVILFKNDQDPRLKFPSTYTYYEKSVMIYGSSSYPDWRIRNGTDLCNANSGAFNYCDVSSQLTDGDYIQTDTGNQWNWGMLIILYS
jgi:hypothetical protein